MMGLFSFCLYKLLHRMPTLLRTPQTSGHSSSYISNIPLWSLKSPPSHGSKIIIFYLSQSKCTVSALFLHGFKGCNGYSDLQNTTEGAEIAGQKITMLCTKNDINSKLLKSECSARWALLIRGPGIRVPSSAQNPTRNRKILRGFSIFWGSAHFCTLFAHRRESRVFPCIVCILCIVSVFSILFSGEQQAGELTPLLGVHLSDNFQHPFRGDLDAVRQIFFYRHRAGFGGADVL